MLKPKKIRIHSKSEIEKCSVGQNSKNKQTKKEANMCGHTEYITKTITMMLKHLENIKVYRK